MSGSWKDSLIRQLHDKEFRDSYVAEDIRTGIAIQIRTLREDRELSQADLGFLAGKAQSAIARLEDPNYGRFSLTTLLEVASTFDVALLVRFVPFSELVRRNTDLSPDAICVPDFSHDDLGGSINRTASTWDNVINLSDRITQTMRTGSAFTLPEPQRDRQARSDPIVEFVLVSDDYKTA